LNLKDGSAVPALAAAFQVQRKARDTLPPRTRAERASSLEALEALLLENAQAFCEAIDRDF